MPILSIEFALFFLIFFTIYWSVSDFIHLQNTLLLVASLGWLAWLNIGFVFMVMGFSFCIYLISIKIHPDEYDDDIRSIWRWIGIIFSVLILIIFKYLDEIRNFIYQWNGTTLMEILFPLGLSYYVFQAVAYLEALYRREIQPFNLPNLCLHFSFFPTITAGPIFRAGHFKSIAGKQMGASIQLKRKRELRFPILAMGLIFLGTLKTWVFSAHLDAFFINPILDNPQQYSSASLLLCIYAYTLSLYFNFSGYSDLVIGLALLLGFYLPKNFLMPLYACNIKDFWSRWHISLSTLIRDYIYIPLGGNRAGFLRTQIHILIAFALSGIWHGNSWNFLIWGILHGLALIILNIKERFFEPSLSIFSQYWGIFLTFNFVSFTFIFFKIHSFSEAGDFFLAFFNNSNKVQFLEYLFILSIYVWIYLYPIWDKIWKGCLKILNFLPWGLWFIPLILFFQLIVFLAPSGIPGFLYANF